MTESPIVCTLTGAELRAGRDELLPGVVASAVARRELPDGLRLELPPSGEQLRRVAVMIDRERRCCRFLTFRLEVGADGAPFVLEVTGPPGTREFLAGLAAAAGSLDSPSAEPHVTP